jgi:hypothetical protein
MHSSSRLLKGAPWRLIVIAVLFVASLVLRRSRRGAECLGTTIPNHRRDHG